MPFGIRTILYQSNSMLNICDSDLLGRTVSESNFTMNISEKYYAERIVGKSEAEDLLKNSSVINMVGKEIISLSIGLGIGSLNGVKKVDGVPFLIVYKF